MNREMLLSETFVELADTLVADFDVVDLLSGLSSRCVDLLDAAAAGLMLADDAGELRVVAASDERLRLLELFELQNEQGPCLDAFQTGQLITSHDLEADAGRWDRFVPAALDSGFRSVHAVPMRLRDTNIGALNLLRSETGPLQAVDARVAQALADVATISILQHRAAAEAQVMVDQLQGALDSRIAIEQAKGILSERMDIDTNEAFLALRRHARNNNARLSDVARDVVKGRLPTVEP
jgi:GAF domain-containing protein